MAHYGQSYVSSPQGCDSAAVQHHEDGLSRDLGPSQPGGQAQHGSYLPTGDLSLVKAMASMTITNKPSLLSAPQPQYGQPFQGYQGHPSAPPRHINPYPTPPASQVSSPPVTTTGSSDGYFSSPAQNSGYPTPPAQLAYHTAYSPAPATGQPQPHPSMNQKHAPYGVPQQQPSTSSQPSQPSHSEPSLSGQQPSFAAAPNQAQDQARLSYSQALPSSQLSSEPSSGRVPQQLYNLPARPSYANSPTSTLASDTGAEPVKKGFFGKLASGQKIGMGIAGGIATAIMSHELKQGIETKFKKEAAKFGYTSGSAPNQETYHQVEGGKPDCSVAPLQQANTQQPGTQETGHQHASASMQPVVATVNHNDRPQVPSSIGFQVDGSMGPHQEAYRPAPPLVSRPVDCHAPPSTALNAARPQGPALPINGPIRPAMAGTVPVSAPPMRPLGPPMAAQQPVVIRQQFGTPMSVQPQYGPPVTREASGGHGSYTAVAFAGGAAAGAIAGAALMHAVDSPPSTVGARDGAPIMGDNGGSVVDINIYEAPGRAVGAGGSSYVDVDIYQHGGGGTVGGGGLGNTVVENTTVVENNNFVNGSTTVESTNFVDSSTNVQNNTTVVNNTYAENTTNFQESTSVNNTTFKDNNTAISNATTVEDNFYGGTAPYSGAEAYVGTQTGAASYAGAGSYAGGSAYPAADRVSGSESCAGAEAYAGATTYAGTESYTGATAYAGEQTYTGQDTYVDQATYGNPASYSEAGTYAGTDDVYQDNSYGGQDDYGAGAYAYAGGYDAYAGADIVNNAVAEAGANGASYLGGGEESYETYETYDYTSEAFDYQDSGYL